MGTSIVPSYLGNFGAFEMPGGMENVGRNIAQLGQSVAGMIDPYLDFHTRLRESLAANPELMTRFADFANENPAAFQSISRMLPKDVAMAVSQTQPSAKATEEAALRPALKKIGAMKESEFPSEPTIAELGAYRRLAGGEPGQAPVSPRPGPFFPTVSRS